MANNQYRFIEVWLKLKKLWTGPAESRSLAASHAELDKFIAESSRVTESENAKM